ncbi:MAG: LOG family protein [Ignavibacteriaceae bacterium]|jgi:hypothetical protein
MKKTITIFGSSIPKPNEPEYETAYKLGLQLAAKGYNICTGGYQGIMDAASKGAVENGAEALGITVNLWGANPTRYLTQEIQCKTLFERITKLVEAGDGYVILQGGTGTLLELSVVWELMNKHLLSTKPAACHSEIWKTVVEAIDKQIQVEGRETGLIKPFNTVEQIVEYMDKMIKK